MKSVAIASGKGGTGKTTMTAVLAWLASRNHAVAVADADVEASNLPLALRVRSQECTEFRGGAKAVISAGECTSCGLCLQVCRFQAVLRPDRGPFSVDRLSCEGCGHCALVCPSGAVTMVPASVGQACRGVSPVGPIAFGQLGPGQDLSGRLVTEVRRLGLLAAQDAGAEVLFIDGPPGTGCPLIAALSSTDLVVAVAEPTLSGVHDLGRLADLAARFRIPVRVVLNKADLSAEGARGLREFCAGKGLPLLAEIPFDRDFAGTLQAMADPAACAALQGSPAWREASKAWLTLASELGLS